MITGMGVAWLLGAFTLGADCNQNGIEDALDIGGGASRDCNANGIPDECDLAPGKIAFEVSHEYLTGEAPMSTATGDLNGDGLLDVAVASYAGNQVAVFKNLGDAVLGERTMISVGVGPRNVLALDLDHDGDIDLVTSNDGSHDLSVILNSGDGTFAAAVGFPVGGEPRRMVLSDLDGDAALDCVVTRGFGAEGGVVVLWSDGFGAFSPAQVIASGPHSGMPLTVDLDGDGDLDIAYAQGAAPGALDSVAVIANEGNRAFTAPLPLATGSAPYALSAGDLDGDGDRDLVVANLGSGTLSLLVNRGNGRFDASVSLETGAGAESVLLADIDGDRDLDIIAAGIPPASQPRSLGAVSVLLNSGGAFGPSLVTRFWGGSDEVLTDLDGDGDLDVAVNGPGVVVLENQGNGVLKPPMYVPVDVGADSLKLADLDVDGDLDVISPSIGTGRVSVMVNATGQTFHTGCQGFLRGDVNADGAVSISDLVALRRYFFDTPTVLPCADAADVLDDDSLDICDMLAIWEGILSNPEWKAPLPAPFPSPGHDPTSITIPHTQHGCPDTYLGEPPPGPGPFLLGCADYSIKPAVEVDDVISMGAAAAGPGELVKFPIYLTSAVAADAVQLVLRYDPSLLEFFPGPDGLTYEGSFFERFFNRTIHVVHCDGHCEQDVEYGDSPNSWVAVHPEAGVVTVLLAGHLFFTGFEVTPGDDILLGWLKARVSPNAAPGTNVSLEAEDGGGHGVGPYRLRTEVCYKGDARYVSILPHVEAARLAIIGDQAFFRGDSNGDDHVNISDAVHSLGVLFLGVGSLDCEDAADADDDGVLDISDAIYTLRYLFVSGSPPPPPFEAKGLDPTEDSRHCYRVGKS